MSRPNSPLKARPLRNPGQGLDEEIARVIDDESSTYVLAALIIVVLAAWEWYRALGDVPPQPVLATILATIAVAVCGYRLFRCRERLKRLRLGRDGERAVGQHLEQFRTTESRVFHDVIADGFNIDHVLVSPKGVFAMETKTRSKPTGGPARLEVGAQGVRLGSLPPDDRPITQARAQARWLSDMLEESTGKRWPVKAVLLFPGWYVERSAHSITDDLWVLNPRAIAAFVENEPTRLEESQRMMIAYHLSRYIRTS